MTENSNTDKEPIEEKEFQRPDYFGSSTVWMGRPGTVRYSLGSLLVILIVSIVVAMAYPAKPGSYGTRVKDAVGWDVLRIDGNRNGRFVEFSHESHQNSLGRSKEKCAICHHLSRPNDGPSSCYQCHLRMDVNSSIFDHDYHIGIYRNQKGCDECHRESKSGSTVKHCRMCHEDYNREITAYTKYVISYQDAMHTLCIGCHRQEDKKMGEESMLSGCSTCHGDTLDEK